MTARDHSRRACGRGASATDELAHLRAWKESAMSSLNDWHELENAVPKWFAQGRLGWPWPRVVAAYIAHLESQVAEQVAP